MSPFSAVKVALTLWMVYLLNGQCDTQNKAYKHSLTCIFFLHAVAYVYVYIQLQRSTNNVTCSGETENNSPAISDWFQILVQTNSVGC